MPNLTKKDAVIFANSFMNMIEELKKSPHKLKGPEYQSYSKALELMSYDKVFTRLYFFNKMLSSIPMKDRENEPLLEIGSGYGFNLLFLRFLGFKKIHGIELVDSLNENANLMLKTAEKYFSFDLSGVSSVNGNAEQSGFADGSFKNIITVEVISHVPSLDRILREINRLLAFGGNFIVSDGNNILCPYYKKKLKKIWQTTRDNELKIRINHIKEHYPAINPQLRASIILHTELLPLGELNNYVDNFLKTGKLPMSLYFDGYAPVFSQSGIWAEYGFEPPKLANQLKKYGFESKIWCYAGSARGGVFELAENLINRLPDKIRFLFRPIFFINAKKTGNPEYLINI